MTILGFSLGKFMSSDMEIGKAKLAVVSQVDEQQDLQNIEKFISGLQVSGGLSAREVGELREQVQKFQLTKLLYQEVLGSPKLQKFIEPQRMTMAEARALLEKGQITAILVVPPHFLYDSFSNLYTPFRNQVTLEIIKNPQESFKAELVQEIVKGYTDAVSGAAIAKNTFLEAAAEQNLGPGAYRELGRVAREGAGDGWQDFDLEVVRTPGTKKISGFQYYAAGMAMMFILYSASFGAHYLLDERKFGTGKRMLLGDVSFGLVQTGRFVATFIFTLLQLALLLAFSILVLRVAPGEWLGVLMIGVASALGVAALALLFATLGQFFRDEKTLDVFATGFITITSLLGGSYLPLSVLPEPVKLVSQFTLNGVALNGLLKLMQGYGPGDILGNVYRLLVIAAIFIGLSVLGNRLAKE